MSITAVSVLQADCRRLRVRLRHHRSTGLPSGTVYPALSRLERDGYVRSAWEDERRAHEEGRPARRYYRVTAPAVRALDEALDLLPQRSFRVAATAEAQQS